MPRPRLIVLCAANTYDGTPMSDWYAAREWSRRHPVLYVDPPVSHLTRLHRGRGRHTPPRRGGVQVIHSRLARFTPVVQPFPSRPATVGFTTLLLRRQLAIAAGALGGRVRAVISGWPQYPIGGACGENITAYWAKDDFAGGAGLLGMDAAMLASRERRVAAQAAVVIAANPTVADSWAQRGHRTVLVPFGADTGLFADVDDARPPPGVDLGGPAALFMGRLNARTDLGLLEAVAGRVPLLVAGPVDPTFEPARVIALLERPNVHWAGPQRREALPGWLRLAGCGLVPYRPGDPFNKGSFPLKTLEYLAAGRPVVSTYLPATTWLGTPLIRTASGPEDFAAEVAKALDGGMAPELVAERRAFAAGHSWERRAGEILAAVEDAFWAV
jgi:glycosyltransferase involved in cell wall biosynthesis